MQLVSPEASSSTPVDAIAPPSYTANAGLPTDEKIVIDEYNPTSTVSPAPTSIMNWDGARSPPILQHHALAQQQQGYAGHGSMSIPMQQAPVHQQTGPTVTPLHLLADQADAVDCPFCQRQTETKIKKSASSMAQ
ncbi:hypothetical protein BFJ68_g16197 [Fusarium oxysporum]|uniref:LITAF domain-containing protein n=1 Tax=Fusarium oxysporum TaxID=5507 RepID=A0A420PFW5_FUSOX|nr:hypothetical protein BFJ68_g16197 [Fusarium oxysporum]